MEGFSDTKINFEEGVAYINFMIPNEFMTCFHHYYYNVLWDKNKKKVSSTTIPTTMDDVKNDLVGCKDLYHLTMCRLESQKR